MFNWISGVLITFTSLSTLASNYGGKLQSLPPQPDQSQIVCHDMNWEQKYLSQDADLQINKTLTPYINRLIRDAKKEGLNIAFTSTYRTCSEQGQLRAWACGLGEYNLKIKPINECVPPTEPAGRSLHNEGLAVDLACTGYGIFEYSPCYKWLKSSSHLYQIKEHQLEPWHWSTTGK